MTVDQIWMRERLESFKALCEEYEDEYSRTTDYTLSAHIAKKANSQLTERELVAQVFSPTEPNPKQPRLHLPGEKSSKTWKSRQEGLHLLAQGAFAGIRNVAVHTDNEWSEHVALERLALVSLVARETDETEIVTAP